MVKVIKTFRRTEFSTFCLSLKSPSSSLVRWKNRWFFFGAQRKERRARRECKSSCTLGEASARDRSTVLPEFRYPRRRCGMEQSRTILRALKIPQPIQQETLSFDLRDAPTGNDVNEFTSIFETATRKHSRNFLLSCVLLSGDNVQSQYGKTIYPHGESILFLAINKEDFYKILLSNPSPRLAFKRSYREWHRQIVDYVDFPYYHKFEK